MPTAASRCTARSTPTVRYGGSPPASDDREMPVRKVQTPGDLSAGAVDAVTAMVIRSAMETICFEMATYVSRTATTPILNQSNERNATILDAEGRLAALSVGIPQFMLSSTLPVRFASEFFEGDLYPGDV